MLIFIKGIPYSILHQNQFSDWISLKSLKNNEIWMGTYSQLVHVM